MRTFLFLYFVFFLFCLWPTEPLLSQDLNQNYVNYIETYQEMAVKLMWKYHIPASITLAQGLLESGAGQSQFVKETNNHFGIKCHTDWNGEKAYHTDEKSYEYFRKYNSAEEAFEDHASFLLKSRYASLFLLDMKDYVGWAVGLQQCGYATDKSYADKLIKIIEDYKLNLLDSRIESSELFHSTSPSLHASYISSSSGLLYVIAKNNDNYKKIAKDTGIRFKKLLHYNETTENMPIEKGDIIYLEGKKKKANVPYFEHVVQTGESMYRVSQLYGIKIKYLYKINQMDFSYVPTEGDILRLR